MMLIKVIVIRNIFLCLTILTAKVSKKEEPQGKNDDFLGTKRKMFGY